jgi:hypothetical protein
VLDAKTAVEQVPGYGNKLGQAMSYGWQIIKGIVLAIVTIWPLILIAVVLWFLYKRSRKPAKQ